MACRRQSRHVRRSLSRLLAFAISDLISGVSNLTGTPEVYSTGFKTRPNLGFSAKSGELSLSEG